MDVINLLFIYDISVVYLWLSMVYHWLSVV